MRRVQLRGGARRPYARRTLGWGSAGAMSGPPQTNNRQCSRPAPNQAWRPRAPHSRRWALLIGLGSDVGVLHLAPIGLVLADEEGLERRHDLLVQGALLVRLHVGQAIPQAHGKPGILVSGLLRQPPAPQSFDVLALGHDIRSIRALEL